MLKLTFLILLFSLLFFQASAENMKVDSISVNSFQIPILKGKAINPVLEIRIHTSGEENSLTLQEINTEIEGTSPGTDLSELSAYFDKNYRELSVNNLYGTTTNVKQLTAIKGEQELSDGLNIFWLALKLTDQAELTNTIKVACRNLTISGHTYSVKNIEKIPELRFGIALRKHLDDGINTYRIPGLVTTNTGTLIAVYDNRKNNATDLQEDIDIGMSRSTDGGRSWAPMKVIMDMGEWGGKPEIENGIGDPSLLVDRKTNTIWVAAVWAHGHPGQRNWFASKPGLQPKETSQLILVKSEDDGLTWSEPINITKQVKNPEWHLLLQGPGKGITTKDGTLVFPAQFKDENEIPHSTIIWSKNRGENWHIGTGAKSHTTEAQVIELNNGQLMLNMRDDRNRNNTTVDNGRAVHVTGDLGTTWTEHPTSNHTLHEPNCMASLIKDTFQIGDKLQSVVLFSNPNSMTSRDHLTIKASFDDGNTWPSQYDFLLDELGGRGYSCMTKIDKKHIGILYEGSQADLVYQIIPIEKIVQQPVLNYIFESGTEGYNTFRIPAIVQTNSGRLLAFAEGRVNGSSDTGNIDLVMKSSDDSGKTWSPLRLIWDDGNNVCGNPAPVVDAQTGEIHLLMTWNLGEDHERDIIDRKSKDTRRVFVSASTDNGDSWTIPKEITSSVKKENWTWYATGPCHGIHMKSDNYKGRLIIPCDHIEAESKQYYSHTIYSDDHGKTWLLGGTTPQHQVNESTVAELPGGKLLLNMRNYDRSQKARKISYSSDGGLTWSDILTDTALIEPICQASMLFTTNNNLLWFLNPANTESRTNMTLKMSTDEGKNWKVFKVLHPGPAAYSDLHQINKNTLGCLFEGGMENPYQGIVFTTVQIEK